MYEALLKATPEYQKIAASFAQPGPAALFGLPPAGRALLYAALQKDLGRHWGKSSISLSNGTFGNCMTSCAN